VQMFPTHTHTRQSIQNEKRADMHSAQCKFRVRDVRPSAH